MKTLQIIRRSLCGLLLIALSCSACTGGSGDGLGIDFGLLSGSATSDMVDVNADSEIPVEDLDKINLDSDAVDLDVYDRSPGLGNDLTQENEDGVSGSDSDLDIKIEVAGLPAPPTKNEGDDCSAEGADNVAVMFLSMPTPSEEDGDFGQRSRKSGGARDSVAVGSETDDGDIEVDALVCEVQDDGSMIWVRINGDVIDTLDLDLRGVFGQNDDEESFEFNREDGVFFLPVSLLNANEPFSVVLEQKKSGKTLSQTVLVSKIVDGQRAIGYRRVL